MFKLGSNRTERDHPNVPLTSTDTEGGVEKDGGLSSGDNAGSVGCHMAGTCTWSDSTPYALCLDSVAFRLASTNLHIAHKFTRQAPGLPTPQQYWLIKPQWRFIRFFRDV